MQVYSDSIFYTIAHIVNCKRFESTWCWSIQIVWVSLDNILIKLPWACLCSIKSTFKVNFARLFCQLITVYSAANFPWSASFNRKKGMVAHQLDYHQTSTNQFVPACSFLAVAINLHLSSSKLFKLYLGWLNWKLCGSSATHWSIWKYGTDCHWVISRFGISLSLYPSLFLIDAILIGPMLCSGWIEECLWVACLGLKWHWRGWRLPQAPLGCLTVGEYNRSAQTLISSAFHKLIRRIVVKYTQIKKEEHRVVEGWI